MKLLYSNILTPGIPKRQDLANHKVVGYEDF